MALAIDIIDGRGLSNEAVEEEEGNAVLLFNQLYITNKMEHFSFKSGCVVHVVKLTVQLDSKLALQCRDSRASIDFFGVTYQNL